MVVDITFLRSPALVYWSVDPEEHDCWRDNPSRNSDAVDSELSHLCHPSNAPWDLSEEEFVLFVNISIGSIIFMDKYGLKSSIQQSRTKTILYQMVSFCWCILCPGLGDAFCLLLWGGSSHEKCQKIETTSLVPISPQAWKSNNIDYIVKLGILWHWTLQ